MYRCNSKALDQQLITSNSPMLSDRRRNKSQTVHRSTCNLPYLMFPCPTLLQVSLFLRDSWITTLRAHIRTSLRDAGKGWFNIYDKNWEGYQQSKLKKLMNYIKYNMEVINFTSFEQTTT